MIFRKVAKWNLPYAYSVSGRLKLHAWLNGTQWVPDTQTSHIIPIVLSMDVELAKK